MPARRVTDYRPFERTYHLLSRTSSETSGFLKPTNDRDLSSDEE